MIHQLHIADAVFKSVCDVKALVEPVEPHGPILLVLHIRLRELRHEVLLRYGDLCPVRRKCHASAALMPHMPLAVGIFHAVASVSVKLNRGRCLVSVDPDLNGALNSTRICGICGRGASHERCTDGNNGGHCSKPMLFCCSFHFFCLQRKIIRGMNRRKRLLVFFPIRHLPMPPSMCCGATSFRVTA